MRSAWLTMLLCLTAPGLLLAQPNQQPDHIGDIQLNEQTYQRLIQRAQALGRNDLVEKLQSKDADVRREAARTLIQQIRQQRGQRGERPGRPGMAGRGNRANFGAWRGRFGMMTPPAVTATDKYLFVVRGDTVYKLDIETLKVLKQTKLPPPEGPRPPQERRPGDNPPAPPAPPK